MAQITITVENKNADLATDKLVRFRKITPSEKTEHPSGQSSIDYLWRLYADQTTDAVAALIQGAGVSKSFGKLTLPNSWPVWFNGQAAEGPIPVPPSFARDGIQSALYLGGKIQYVQESPQEVFDAIKAVGGKPVPVVDARILSETQARSMQQSLTTDKVWDSDVPELQLPVAQTVR